MEVPEIRYARSGDVSIAYQRFGSGPDVVSIPPLISNVEIMWEHEVFRRFLELRASRTRVLQFDKRGIGMSDRVAVAPTLDQRIGDVLAVMDAEGVARASVLGVSEGALMAQHFAATHPERVDRLVLVNAVPGFAALGELPAYAEEPMLPVPELLARFARLVETWGHDPAYMADWFIPSHARSASFLRWLGRFQRQSASPADLRRQIENVGSLSMQKERLARIAAPTLVVHVRGDRVQPVAAGRYLAANIPGAELLVVEGEDHFCFTMPSWHELTTRINDFLCGVEADAVSDGPPAIAAAGTTPASPLVVRDRAATLRREGAIWRIECGGRAHGLPHLRGLSDLQYLVLHPHVEVHVGDLDAAGGDASAAPRERGDAGEVLDERARRAYQERMRDLRADLDDAERCNDLGRTERVRAELEAIEAQLRGAFGLGGRARRAASGHERLRIAVGKRIRLAIERIAAVDPDLGEHLRKAVRTGTHCVYAPAAGEALDWSA